jgi:uncharacterized membrane protein
MSTSTSPSRHPTHSSNISRPERWLSVAGGGFLAYAASQRGWLGRLLLGGVSTALLYRGVTGHSAAYKRMGVDGSADGPSVTAIEIDEAVTVYGMSPGEVYDFWRDVENFPRFMHHLRSVEKTGDDRSRWTAQIPKDWGTVSWEAEVVADERGKRMAWESLPDAEVKNAGHVHFAEAPRGDGTEVRVQLSYRPPGGKAGALVGHLLNPANEQMIKDDVRRFKNLMEAGEVPRLNGQPTGKGRK